MKVFIALCFLAVAFAEPEAEADPYLLYGGYAGYAGYGYAGYRSPVVSTYSTGYPYAAGYASPYATYGYGRLFKREAEADSEADPVTIYSNAYPYAYNTPYAYNAAYAPSVYRAPVAYTPHHVAYSAPAVNHVAYTAPIVPATHVTQYNGAVKSTAAINSHAAFPGAYANAGTYYANSAGTVHVAKREAEAEPEAEADPYLLYGNAYGYNYSPYRSTFYNRPIYRPYSAFGYRYHY